ncbi:hypothetical protein NT90_14370 [Acinetobacter baumannii]|nr:hypothetical protein NT90_14370 [Acinetobacter baumannii]
MIGIKNIKKFKSKYIYCRDITLIKALKILFCTVALPLRVACQAEKAKKITLSSPTIWSNIPENESVRIEYPD